MADDDKKRFVRATNILKKELEHLSTPVMQSIDMTGIKERTFLLLLEAGRDSDKVKLLMAIDLMIQQTSVRDVALDIRRALARQYGP